MSGILHSCDMVEMANFRTNRKKKSGHIVSLKVGKEEIQAGPDGGFKLTDPMNATSDVPLSATITRIIWDKKEGGYVTIEGRVPEVTKGSLQYGISAADKCNECEINFNVYASEGENVYYKAFHTKDAVIIGKLIVEDCFVDDEPATDFTGVPNYHFRLVFEGKEGLKQELHCNNGNKKIEVLRFGK